MVNKYFPYFLFKRLWGNRREFGIKAKQDDADWLIWQEKAVSDFYHNTQKKGVGNWVCSLAYFVIEKVDFGGKKVLEVGPGIIRHLEYIKNKPPKYVICDVNQEFLAIAQEQLCTAKIPYEAVLVDRESKARLPFPEKSFDIVISFNSLEHFYPLDDYILEMKRILKRGGQLVGAIPCEGGLAWGLGRFLTTRRYVHRKFCIDYDKIICWEHPNFADHILEELEEHFERKFLKLLPLPRFPIDLNLVASFVFVKT